MKIKKDRRNRGLNPRICAVPGCLSIQNNGRNYHRFPRDSETCKLWLDAIGCPKLKVKSPEYLIHCFVCDLHFDQYNVDVITKRKRRKALTVVPTLNLTASENEYPSKITQTIDKELLVPPEVTEPETKKRKGLRNSAVSPELKALIKLKKELKKTLSRFNEKKIHYCALYIFLGSPQSYRIFGPTLGLPSERTLRQTFVGTNLSSNMLQCLQGRVNNFNEQEKCCIICADEIELQCNLYYLITHDKIVGFHEIDGKQTAEPATHALIVMARGLFSDWQQPLGYCFLGESKNYSELNMWINGMISKVLHTGLKIVAFIPAQSSFFSHMAEERVPSHLETHFTVDENEIYFIFDTPKLIKSLIDDLMTHNLEFHDVDGTNVTATWNDIETLHMVDSERSHRLAPGLTKGHIDQSQAKNMNIDLAKESFSKKVAAAMNFYKDQGLMSEKCLGTIKLIALLDKTFDTLNSSLPTYPTANRNQMEILNCFRDFLHDVTVRDKNTGEDRTNEVKCLNGLKISLKSIIELSHHFLWKGFGALPLQRLNQNILQDFLDKLRQPNSKPTPLQLSRAFQKLFMTQLLSHSRRSDDLDQFLEHTDHALASIENWYESTEGEPLNVRPVDYRFKLPKQHALRFVSELLLYKCQEMHRCDQFDEYIRTSARKDGGSGVLNPPDSFVELIMRLDDKFVNCILNKTFVNIGSEMLEAMKQFELVGGCPCFPLSHLKKLFIRFRIFNTVCSNNKSFKDDTSNPKCFRVRKLTLSKCLVDPFGNVTNII